MDFIRICWSMIALECLILWISFTPGAPQEHSWCPVCDENIDSQCTEPSGCCSRTYEQTSYCRASVSSSSGRVAPSAGCRGQQYFCAESAEVSLTLCVSGGHDGGCAYTSKREPKSTCVRTTAVVRCHVTTTLPTFCREPWTGPCLCEPQTRCWVMISGREVYLPGGCLTLDEYGCVSRIHPPGCSQIITCPSSSFGSESKGGSDKTTTTTTDSSEGDGDKKNIDGTAMTGSRVGEAGEENSQEDMGEKHQGGDDSQDNNNGDTAMQTDQGRGWFTTTQETTTKTAAKGGIHVSATSSVHGPNSAQLAAAGLVGSFLLATVCVLSIFLFVAFRPKDKEKGKMKKKSTIPSLEPYFDFPELSPEEITSSSESPGQSPDEQDMVIVSEEEDDPAYAAVKFPVHSGKMDSGKGDVTAKVDSGKGDVTAIDDVGKDDILKKREAAGEVQMHSDQADSGMDSERQSVEAEHHGKSERLMSHPQSGEFPSGELPRWEFPIPGGKPPPKPPRSPRRNPFNDDNFDVYATIDPVMTSSPKPEPSPRDATFPVVSETDNNQKLLIPPPPVPASENTLQVKDTPRPASSPGPMLRSPLVFRKMLQQLPKFPPEMTESDDDVFLPSSAPVLSFTERRPELTSDPGKRAKTQGDSPAEDDIYSFPVKPKKENKKQEGKDGEKRQETTEELHSSPIKRTKPRPKREETHSTSDSDSPPRSETVTPIEELYRMSFKLGKAKDQNTAPHVPISQDGQEGRESSMLDKPTKQNLDIQGDIQSDQSSKAGPFKAAPRAIKRAKPRPQREDTRSTSDTESPPRSETVTPIEELYRMSFKLGKAMDQKTEQVPKAQADEDGRESTVLDKPPKQDLSVQGDMHSELSSKVGSFKATPTSIDVGAALKDPLLSERPAGQLEKPDDGPTKGLLDKTPEPPETDTRKTDITSPLPTESLYSILHKPTKTQSYEENTKTQDDPEPLYSVPEKITKIHKKETEQEKFPSKRRSRRSKGPVTEGRHKKLSRRRAQLPQGLLAPEVKDLSEGLYTTSDSDDDDDDDDIPPVPPKRHDLLQ